MKKKNTLLNIFVFIIIALIIGVLILLLIFNKNHIKFDIIYDQHAFVGEKKEIILDSISENVLITCKNTNIMCLKRSIQDNKTHMQYEAMTAGKGQIEINYNNNIKLIDITICNKLNIQNQEIIVALNKTYNLDFEIEDICLNDYNFKIDDESIAKYSNRVITGTKVGNTNLHITKENDEYIYNIIVLNESDISFKNSDGTINTGEEKKYSVLSIDDNFTCQSSDENIFTVTKVDDGCNVVAKEAGTATLTAKKGDNVASQDITINQLATNIMINETNKVVIGKSITIPVTIEPENTTNKEFQCTSLDSDIALASFNGDSCLVKGIKIGTTNIKATINELEAVATIIVESDVVDPTSISLNTNVIKLSVGGKGKIEATILPENATVKKVNWSSDNSSIVSVDENGQIIAKKAGIAVIKAETINGKMATIPVISTGSSLITEYDSPTLKYYIEKAGTYHNNTYIWVKDAYSQFKVAITEPQKNNSPTPRKAQTAQTIINYLLRTNNYSGKGLIIANGGAMVSDRFNSSTPKNWYGTSAIPLVLHNGTVIRDSSNEKFVSGISYFIYGMKKDGFLTYYTYKNGATQEEKNYNKSVFQGIRDDGVLYTFGFAPILVDNGKVTAASAENNIRQALCQIDKNSFIIVTNTNKTNNRGVGFSISGLAEYMKNMNCKRALNMDGGGSTSFYYKKKNENPQKVNTGYDGRYLSDMVYFVEQ